MSHADILTKPVYELIPEGKFTVLDVACGFGDWGYFIKTRKKGNYILTGIEVWKPYLERLSRVNIYDELIEVDLRYYGLKKRYDLILACEILEHLRKDEGYELLDKLESACDVRIIVTTPYGYTHQDALDGNDFQRHLSSWGPKDLKSRGYKIKVIRQPLRPKRIPKRIINSILGKPYAEFIVAHKDMMEINLSNA